jgi:hypothetical protein
MASEIEEIFSEEFRSVEDVIDKLSRFEQCCLGNHDLRGVFATAYLLITRSIHAHLDDGLFRNDEWSKTYLVRFGNLYREAVLNDESNNGQPVPKSWNFSFETSRKKEGLIIQHLLLGINAHINHDLAVALYDVGIDPDRDDKYTDHILINQILEQSTDSLKKEVGIKYAPILKRLDRKTGRISDDVTNFSIPKARDHAWSFAIALTRASGRNEQEILRKTLDDQAAVLARLIMASPTRHPRFTRTVSFLKWVDGLFDGVRRFFRRG